MGTKLTPVNRTDEPQITVIVATYGRDRLIWSTLESLRRQSFTNFSALIVSDGPPSSELKMVVRLFDERFRLLSLPERSFSQSGPNNLGLEHAATPFVAYLGHDDVWHPSHLQQVLTVFLKRPEVDVVVSGAVMPGPPGVSELFCWVSGLFDPAQERIGETYFFPPSSVSHKAQVASRGNRWPDPQQTRGPVDSVFFLGLARRGAKFSTTNVVTVIKFNSALRYLSYLAPEDTEQRAALKTMNSSIRYKIFVRRSIRLAKRNRTFHFMRHQPELSPARPGDTLRRFNVTRGLRGTESRELRGREFVALPSGELGFDWYYAESDGFGVFRWSGPSARSRVVIPFHSAQEASFDLRFGSFITSRVRNSMDILLNGTSITVSWHEGSPRNHTLGRFRGPLLNSGPSIIEFRVRRPVQVSSVDRGSPDNRKVGFQFYGLWVENNDHSST